MNKKKHLILGMIMASFVSSGVLLAVPDASLAAKKVATVKVKTRRNGTIKKIKIKVPTTTQATPAT